MLGGITVVLYGMIGLLGAKIWMENRVDFANPVNLVPIAAGIIIAIGNVSLAFTDDFTLTGIALGTIVAIVGYHLARRRSRRRGAAADDAGREVAVGRAPARARAGRDSPVAACTGDRPDRRREPGSDARVKPPRSPTTGRAASTRRSTCSPRPARTARCWRAGRAWSRC